MKTIITLIAFGLVSTTALAGSKNPSLTVTSSGEYVIIIDGKRYEHEKRILVTGLGKGIHYIDVFKKKKGLFGSKYRLVSSKQFEMPNNKDLLIDINASGYITIGKQGEGWDGDYWYRNRDKKKEKELNKNG